MELDVFRNLDDNAAEGPEYYCAVDTAWRAYQPNLDAVDAVFEAARSYMELYRRQRSQLLWKLLSDCLAYDLFDLIDAYGAAPIRKTVPSISVL